MEPNEEQLKNIFLSLPEDIRTAVVSSEFEQKISAIAVKNNLFIDVQGKLVTEITRVVCGLTKVSEFKPELKKRLGIDDELAEKIITDVNELIFKPIRASLQKIHGEYKEKSAQKEIYPAPENLPIAPDIEKVPEISPPATIVESSGLENEDEKILRESGIEIEKPLPLSEKPVEETLMPTKSAILGAIENPEVKSKEEGVSLPAGFSLGVPTPQTKPLQEIGVKGAIHEEKLAGSPSFTNQTIPLVPQTTPENTPPLPSDPYREPIG